MSIQISLATDTDFKPLAPVAIKSQELNLTQRLLFDRSEPGAAQEEINLAEVDIWTGIKSDNFRVWKATIHQKGWDQPLGLSMITFTGPEVPKRCEEAAVGYRHIPKELNLDLLEFRRKELDLLRWKHLNGQKHVVWQGLYVLPEYQRKGIGSELMRWGFEHFSLSRETIWLETTVPEPFLCYGWEQVDVLDIDLSKWGGENKGYGAYRNYIMIRKPGEFKRVSPAVK